VDPYVGVTRASVAAVWLPIQDLVSTLSEFVIYDPQTYVLRGTQPDEQQLDPLGIQGGRLAEAIKLLLEPHGRFGQMPLEELFSLIPWARAIDVSAPTSDLLSPSIPATRELVRFEDRYMREQLNRLSAYDASEGALYVLFTIALLFHPKAPRFFAIENVGHALHPRLARKLVEVLGQYARSSKKQVLLTTHNPLVLDGLDLKHKDIRLFTVDRTESGRTVVTRINYSDALAKAKKEGATLSQMWTSGLLGAVPDLW
jgi:hypothetical protein